MTDIAFYLPSLHGGGAERVTVILANGLAARGHRVDMVLVNAEGPFLREISPNIRLIDLASRNVSTSILKLSQYIRKEKPKAMISALNHCNIAAITARRLSGHRKMRLGVSEHNAPSHALSGGGMNAIIRVLTYLLYPFADAIICVSQGIRDEMCELLGRSDKLTCIYNPLDVDYIQAKMVSPPDHPWFIERREPVIIAAGRLTRQKDYPTLLHAFAMLVSRIPARLIILGQGDDKSSLETLASNLDIANRVFFAGFQDNPFSWIHASDLYVLSSQWEGLPGTLLEALACGARIVSTDCRTGPGEILENGKWGQLVPVCDPSKLALAMASALEDKNPPATEHRANNFRIQFALEGYIRVMEL